MNIKAVVSFGLLCFARQEIVGCPLFKAGYEDPGSALEFDGMFVGSIKYGWT